MGWKIAEAKQKFWRRQGERTLAQEFERLRRICEEEDYTLEVPCLRQDRLNPSPMPLRNSIVDINVLS